MRALLCVTLFVIPFVAGCLGGGDDALDPNAFDGGGDVPTLPPGLAMEGAEVVSRNDASLRFSWSASTEPGSATSPTTAGVVHAADSTGTTVHLPEGPHYRLLLDLTWDAADHLVLAVKDPSGQIRCLSKTDVSLYRPIACGFPHLTGPAETGSWSVEVSARPAAAGEAGSATPIPFTVEVTVGALPAPSTVGTGVHVVLGFEDSGVNPYHQAFRDDSPEAYQHPSTYLSGYPADAVALDLTLDAATFEKALEADRDTWETIERGVLYWIPGTKIVGAVGLQTTPADQATDGVPCYPILDCNGHGTRTISRAIGTDLSLCADCRVTVVSDGPVGTPWLAAAPWVDVIVDEFVDEVAVDRTISEAVGAAMPLVAPTMNYPVPAARYNFHTPGTVSVGGQDNGQPWPTHGSMPHVVADSCMVPTAQHDSLSGTGTPSGTSYAAPFVAGAMSQVIHQVREMVGDDTVGVRDRVIAEGTPLGDADGPLADGRLTVEELRRILYATADPRPGSNEYDGATCLGGPEAPLPELSEPVPLYFYIGYGAVNQDSIDHAIRVVAGEEPLPQRPVEDAFFALDQEVRKALVEAVS